jgi:hypothetical protein
MFDHHQPSHSHTTHTHTHKEANCYYNPNLLSFKPLQSRFPPLQPIHTCDYKKGQLLPHYTPSVCPVPPLLSWTTRVAPPPCC